MNNNNIFFIGEDEIKQQTSLMNDVENQFIRIHILEAQNIELQPIICEDYYSYLVGRFTAYYDCLDSGGTCVIEDFLTADDLKLLNDYIQPFLIYATLYHSSYDLFLKLTNRGVASIDNNHGRGTNEEDLDYYRTMRKDWKNKMIHYMNSMIKYLNKNVENYIIYKSCIDDDCEITEKNTHYGLYLGPEI
jgi:hypothetical protein